MKRIRLFLGVLVVLLLVCAAKTTTYAYTDEEKAQAKAWLSANGYSPDASGAAQAYADYMAGKFGKIDGLPDPDGYVDPAQEEQRKKAEREQAESEQQESKQRKDQKKQAESEGGDSTEIAPDQDGSTDGGTPVIDGSGEDAGASDGNKKDSTASDKKQGQDSLEIQSPSPVPTTEASPTQLPEISDEIKEQIKNIPASDSGAENGQGEQAEEGVDMLSPEDMERIRLLAAVAKEAESFEESGKQFGITQKDRMVAMILGCVAGVLVIGGVITGLVLAKKKKH